MKNQNQRSISARIMNLLSADSVPLSDAWKRLIDDAEHVELQERRKADSEPVTYQSKWIGDGVWRSCSKSRYEKLMDVPAYEVRELYAAPQPASDSELQERRKPQKPIVTFYSEGIAAAANWVDQQRESYDNEHGHRDNDTGSFEFGNDAQRDYSDTLAGIAEGIWALHPSTRNGQQERGEPIAWMAIHHSENVTDEAIYSTRQALDAFLAQAGWFPALTEIKLLYAAPQPAPERDRIRREHAEWSDSTFGNVGPIGPLKHLSKEALEAAADPSDPLEWADMQFLLWDAQRRMGISDEFITRAMVEKLAINKGRQWPEPKDGEPRMHIKEDATQLSGSTEQLNQAPVKQPASKCPKCGDRGTYYDSQMRGSVFCDHELKLVSAPYKLPPNSFTDGDLEAMAHGDNPQSNAYRELLAFRRNSPVTPDSSTCKYCGGTGYFRWQQSENMCPCPCKGCTELAIQ